MSRPPESFQKALAALAELAWQAGPLATPQRQAASDGQKRRATDSGDGDGGRPLRGGLLAETQYRTLIEQIPAVTFVASLSGGSNAMYVSPQIEDLLGFSQKEWISDPVLWYRQTHPDDRARVSAKFAKTLSTGLPFRDVFRVHSKAGNLRWIDAEARFVRDEDGHLLFLQGVGFNVTEQVQARDAREELIRSQAARAEADRARRQVEEALRIREEFFHIASHELRTPVTSLLGQAQLAQRRLAKGDGVDTRSVASSLEVIVHQARRLSLLVGQLLDVSRLEGDKLRLSLDRVDLVALVAEVVRDARLLSDRHTIRLTAPDALEAYVDALRVEQVVTNLVGNAIKYSPRGGDVDVELSGTADTAVLSVRDRGIGIAPELRGRIFERYYQAHDDQIGGGMGLGLYITKQVVDLHGGGIRAEFPEDGGTRLVVDLPRRMSDAPGA